MGFAGMREATVRWRHTGRRVRAQGASLGQTLRRFEGAFYVLECAAQTAGYAALTLGAAWLLWRFVP
jgi:hypothetical protein